MNQVPLRETKEYFYPMNVTERFEIIDEDKKRKDIVKGSANFNQENKQWIVQWILQGVS